MIPSNPSNGQPLIFRICDALGTNHLVACFNHTHEQSEVEGLISALAGKQNMLTFDSTPTANSNNPVTSGGVEAALGDKLSITTYDEEHFNRVSLVPYFENSLDWGFEINLREGVDGTEHIARISVGNISNLILALTEMDSFVSLLNGKATKVANATVNNFAALDSNGNIKDSGKKASDFANKVHGHYALDAGEARVSVEEITGNVEIYGSSINIDITNEDDVIINASNVGNLSRALQTPDSTPTANSDNLVTSGGVATAITNAQNRPVTLLYVTLTNRINVTQLENDRVYSAYTTQNISIAECFTGGTINWIGTMQTESHPGFFFRFYKVPYEGWGDNYYIEIIATKDDY